MTKRKRNDEPIDPGAQGGNWSAEEQMLLLTALRNQLPENDTKSYIAQMNHIDWDSISVRGRTKQECQDQWGVLFATLRKYRTLTDLLTEAQDKVTNPEGHPAKKRKNVPQHPDHPTRPMTAFIRYLTENRQKEKNKHPELSGTEMTKHLSHIWQQMSPHKQNKYIARYHEEWEQYQKDRAKFIEDHPECVSSSKPPKPPSPFDLFCKAKTDSIKRRHPELDNLALANKQKSKYARLSEGKKMKWINKAKEAVPEYKDQMAAYLRQHPTHKAPQYSIKLTKEEKLICGERVTRLVRPKNTKFVDQPQKPPRSAFLLFMSRKLQEDEASDSKEKMRNVSQKWRTLSDKKKSKYTKKLARLQRRYARDLEEYKETLSPEDLAEFEDSLKPITKRVTKRKPAETKAASTTNDTEHAEAETTLADTTGEFDELETEDSKTPSPSKQDSKTPSPSKKKKRRSTRLSIKEENMNGGADSDSS